MFPLMDGFSHDDVIKWKHIPRNWPFVRGIHRPRWIPHTKASDAELWCFFDLRLNKRLSKQPWGWWSETPSSSLWRHRNGFSVLLAIWSSLSSLAKETNKQYQNPEVSVVELSFVELSYPGSENDRKRPFLTHCVLEKLAEIIQYFEDFSQIPELINYLPGINCRV